MPFKSKEQRSFLKREKPELYKEWVKKYGNKIAKIKLKDNQKEVKNKMPYKDKTGPEGKGPRTGRKLGCCEAGYTPFVDEKVVGKTQYWEDIPNGEKKEMEKKRMHKRREHRDDCHHSY